MTSQAEERVQLGADVILRVCEEEGIKVCFGMPGGAILPLYDAIARGTSLRHVLVRHEQGAGHMAEGYARASGTVGATFATSGPGATNLVTPIANAAMDALGFTVASEAAFDRALAEALASGWPAVIDVLVSPDEKLYPMIEPGAAAVDVLEFAA